MNEKSNIDEITKSFFGIFSNRNIQPNLESIYELCIAETIIIKMTGRKAEVYNLKTFIEPRKELLSNGTLTDFEEWETDETTIISRNLAQRESKYKKKGILSGEPFEGNGNKFFQFIKTNNGWKINSVIWEDDN